MLAREQRLELHGLNVSVETLRTWMTVARDLEDALRTPVHSDYLMLVRIEPSAGLLSSNDFQRVSPSRYTFWKASA